MSPALQYPITFESFVNSERCKTVLAFLFVKSLFESFVNSERCKTHKTCDKWRKSLRALLIQKDVKLTVKISYHILCLRALLIQKDVKLFIDAIFTSMV